MAEAVAKRLDKLLVAATVVRVVADVLLAQVDLLMPFSPDFGGCEHATRSTLVTERGLTGSVCTTTRDTGNTSDSTTCVVVRNHSVSFSRHHADPHAPVPQDSAEVCSPAFSLTAYGCLLFLAIPVWTVLHLLACRRRIVGSGDFRTGQCRGGLGS